MVPEYSATVPKKGDRVGIVEQLGLFEVVDVNMLIRTVNLKTTDGQGHITRNVPWTSLMFHVAKFQCTQGYLDRSTENTYQFEFYCGRCGNGFISELRSIPKLAESPYAGDLGGGFAGWPEQPSSNAKPNLEKLHYDLALKKASEELRTNFQQCPECARWVCQKACWNIGGKRCYDCSD